jgi:hypothetical protein
MLADLLRRFPLPNMKFHGKKIPKKILPKFWGLGPLVWEEMENAQTVVNAKLNFLYRSYNFRSESNCSIHWQTNARRSTKLARPLGQRPIR